MTNFKTIFTLFAFVLGVSTFCATANAMDLDEARAKGYIGERADGLVEAVEQTTDGEITSLVKNINAKRVEKYRAIAAKNGVPVESVMARTGQLVIQKAPQGTYYKDAAGQWHRK